MFHGFHIFSGIVVMAALSAPASAGPVAPFSGEALGSPAQSQIWRVASRRTSSLKRLDADKDGTLTKEEYLRPKKREFGKLDTNKDGGLDLGELSEQAKQRSTYSTKRYMKRLDADGDGRITLSEFEVGPRARFAERDLNSDGTITADERSSRRRSFFSWATLGWGKAKKSSRRKKPDPTLESMLAATKAEFQRLDGNADGVIDFAEAGKEQAERAARAGVRAMHRLDADKNQTVSEAEFTAKSQQRFQTLDLDSDGSITAADLPPYQRAAWARRR